ncbi:hypothetical protein FACS189438_2630 [Bacteroidia bacterium]|nr:hypothetical protein FACS189438_2630 [Bacteroidia bacterium]
MEWASRSQQKLMEPIGQLRLPESAKSVLATITVGYRKEMPRETRRQFSVAGVAHILSVSGFHVAIVCNFISFALSFLRQNRAGKWVHYALTLLLLWAFTAITGFAPSSIRAALMLSFYLSGRQLSRITDKYNTLFASAFCMLAYNPFYLFDIGFQLSYAAVASIQYFCPPLQALIKLRNPLVKEPWAWITISIAAQIGATFLCLYYFGQFSTVFLLTNLPLTLIATLLIPSALIWMLLPAGFPLCGILQRIIESLCQSLVWIVETFSRVPGAALNFRFDLPTTLLCYFALFLFCYIRFKQSTKPSSKKQNHAGCDPVFD